METTTKRRRVLVAVVEHRAHPRDADAMREVTTVLRGSGYEVVRCAHVQDEPQSIRTMIADADSDNEADAIVVIGGACLGPSENAIEAVDGVVHRHIEGFGEAYRRLLRADVGVLALLARATAGVFHRTVVFALAGSLEEVRFGVETLIVPTCGEAIDRASGAGDRLAS